jgi:hypothetical protein
MHIGDAQAAFGCDFAIAKLHLTSDSGGIMPMTIEIKAF